MIIKDHKLASTPRILINAEKQLLDQTSSNEMLWLGRAASALIMAYKTIIKVSKGIKSPEIILPTTSCSTPSNTALFCGLKPRYADIDIKTGLITLDTIKKRYTHNTVAVLFIHLYGNTANITEIKKWCLQKNILLIEDNAQALGAKLENGNTCGIEGDFIIYSFNKTKIIESGGGGL